ncbi:Imm1 family immunity protein [Verrucosispora sp. WMMD573]|nr:Imm1 family immunity protein [Verrucosispora sp. WMMD573]WBB53840.1 Imm1 family immunity protein [Verrucosispora sp. WMMD573]
MSPCTGATERGWHEQRAGHALLRSYRAGDHRPARRPRRAARPDSGHPRVPAVPVMVSLETSDKEHVLEVCLGRHDLSVLVWHHAFVEIAASKGTLDQPADLAYNFGGSRTDAYDNSAIPVATARQAVREFFTTNGQRPTCLDWQTPSYEPAKG